MPPYRNTLPKPSARKTLNALLKAELLELAVILDVPAVRTMRVAEIRQLLQPAIELAVAAGTTHVNFTTILPPPRRNRGDDGVDEDEEDEEDEDEDAPGFNGIQGRQSPPASSVSVRSNHRLAGPASVASTARRGRLLARIARGRRPMPVQPQPGPAANSRGPTIERSVSPQGQSEPDIEVELREYLLCSGIISLPALVPPLWGIKLNHLPHAAYLVFFSALHLIVSYTLHPFFLHLHLHLHRTFALVRLYPSTRGKISSTEIFELTHAPQTHRSRMPRHTTIYRS
jgi:hypothetical protein